MYVQIYRDSREQWEETVTCEIDVSQQPTLVWDRLATVPEWETEGKNKSKISLCDDESASTDCTLFPPTSRKHIHNIHKQ